MKKNGRGLEDFRFEVFWFEFEFFLLVFGTILLQLIERLKLALDYNRSEEI